jgi:hypothetical protein
MSHNFYVIEKTFKSTLSQYHDYINDPVKYSGKITIHRLPPLSTCIEYYSKFGNNNPPITEHTTIESLLRTFLNNADNIALIINVYEVTSLMFKGNRNPGYEDAKLDYQTNINLTPHTVQLSISIEKEKQELQKQIDNYNLLISENMSFIKDKQKELAKNRKEVKQLTYKLNEYTQKHPFISMNNSISTSPSSPYSVLSPEELPSNWTHQQMRDFITKRIIKDRTEFKRRDCGGDFVKYSNKDVMLEKLKEFKLI